MITCTEEPHFLLLHSLSHSSLPSTLCGVWLLCDVGALIFRFNGFHCVLSNVREKGTLNTFCAARVVQFVEHSFHNLRVASSNPDRVTSRFFSWQGRFMPHASEHMPVFSINTPKSSEDWPSEGGAEGPLLNWMRCSIGCRRCGGAPLLTRSHSENLVQKFRFPDIIVRAFQYVTDVQEAHSIGIVMSLHFTA